MHELPQTREPINLASLDHLNATGIPVDPHVLYVLQLLLWGAELHIAHQHPKVPEDELLQEIVRLSELPSDEAMMELEGEEFGIVLRDIAQASSAQEAASNLLSVVAYKVWADMPQDTSSRVHLSANRMDVV
jgi:hypothetical protein